MSRRRVAGMAAVMAWLMAGCAHVQLAPGEYMCKHCNCVMPANVDPDKICPVCKCKRLAHECRRGA